ncbi:hypothetical protein HDV03_005212 [Kappamyces sp. JEL0829]|nr:hypothetical protein HDV03_005212 [Kappamyces sp. JEL0829]
MIKSRQHNKILVGLFFVLSFMMFMMPKSAPKTSTEQETYIALRRGPSKSRISLQQRFDILFKEKDDNDINLTKLGYQLRLWKEIMGLADHSRSANPDSTPAEFSDLLHTIDNTLFPWIQPGFSSSAHLRSSFSGRGIVVCVHDAYADMAIGTIKMIRQVLKSDLPVEVFFMGDADLSLDNQKRMNELPKTTARDLYQLFDGSKLDIWGWAIKAFALMACSFQEAILIDADVIFLQAPENLFHTKIYQQHRALFFQDRSMVSVSMEQVEGTKEYIERLAPKPLSGPMLHLRLFHDHSSHQQESGVVVVDKLARFYGMMATCMLNVGLIRQESYKHMYGDKETFWIGFETVQDDYGWNPYLPGSIGVESTPPRNDGMYEVCSIQILHADENHEPVWFNGGIMKNKILGDQSSVVMKEFILEKHRDLNGEDEELESMENRWVLGKGNFACILSQSRPVRLGQDVIEKIERGSAILLHTP